MDIANFNGILLFNYLLQRLHKSTQIWLPNSPLFSVIKISAIEKVFINFIIRSTRSMDCLAFFM